ncbi:MAG TPA: gephyrin-like molybdotransferase Glp [Pseudonocardiaceae bacterium]|jgi:molybdopterin molybdotransferase|nr:gephyrin-like molybdotransferase Glp [Pseudonocardiaceae bacterium]
MAKDPNPSKRPISVEKHKATISALVGELPVLDLPLAECLGLVLAADLASPVFLPPFDNSAMDGYAVRAADLRGASATTPVELPVAGDIPAGRTDPVHLAEGTALRIMTGAPLPSGADGVIAVEQTDGGVSRVALFTEIRPGNHLRRRGEDVVAGDVVLPAGSVLTPARLGLAAAVGSASLPVRRPRVLVLSTGSELVEAGQPLATGQIYESNGMLLASSVRAIGGVAEVLRFVPDDVGAFHAALAEKLPGADLLITSGGVSAGAYEVVKDALTGQGVEFLRVAMQPGGPQGAGRYLGVAVATLPGNPVSAALSFELFLRPALLAAMGHREVERPSLTARLAKGVTTPVGRRQYRRADYDPETGLVEVLGGPGSHLLASLAAANCLLVVPEDASELPDGAQVTVLLLDEH